MRAAPTLGHGCSSHEHPCLVGRWSSGHRLEPEDITRVLRLHGVATITPRTWYRGISSGDRGLRSPSRVAPREKDSGSRSVGWAQTTTRLPTDYNRSHAHRRGVLGHRPA